MKRFLALVLALAMVMAVTFAAVSCDDNPAVTTTSSSKNPDGTTASTGGNDGTTASTGGNDGTTASTSEGTTDNTGSGDDSYADWDPRQDKVPGYENVTFGGAVFNIAGYKEYSDPDYDNEREVYSTRTDSISVAANERTLIVEQLYDCDIVFLGAPNPASLVSAAATGDTPVHLVGHMQKMAAYHTGSYYNLYNLDIDLEQPWFNQEHIKSYTIKTSDGRDTIYTVTGDFTVTSYALTHALMFNKKIYEDSIKDKLNIDIYQLVRDGKWTMDVFAQIITEATKDTNGNSVISTEDGDILGWIATNLGQQQLHVASGLKMFENVDGKITFAMSNNVEQWTTMLSKAIEIYQLPAHEELSYTPAIEALAGGKALFYSELLYKLENDVLKNADIEISCVPNPKYSESQENYANYVMTRFISYCVPSSVANIDEVADFFTVYAAHSMGIVRPAWLDAYSYEYLSGAESREMLEYILDARTFDPGYTIFTFEGIPNDMIAKGQNMVAVNIQRREPLFFGPSGTVTQYLSEIDKTESN